MTYQNWILNPMEFLDTIYSKGEVPDPDDDLLSLEDDHIFELRKFVSNESIERKEFVKAIPLGKWNLLPEQSNVVRKTLAMEQVKIDTKYSDVNFQ
jgi:hypothetical protein